MRHPLALVASLALGGCLPGHFLPRPLPATCGVISALSRPLRATTVAGGRRDATGGLVVAVRWDDGEVRLYRVEGGELVGVEPDELSPPLRRLGSTERLELRGEVVTLTGARTVRGAALPQEWRIPPPAIPLLLLLVPPALVADAGLGAVELVVIVLAMPLLAIAELAR